ncbi:hypothetical protein RRG08_000367 [Elysia crispata]|uniref:Uncharacterized protein n=1 Tax=Elysia crispata TaxID=231223 RepID=A0AAE1DRA5_9GAST|nr:hypothetical protein RRG08_000367 [Elysia crispata]
MKLLVPALFALLAPLVLASQNICYPPKSTTVGFLTLSEAHSYSINDYENGILYFAPGDKRREYCLKRQKLFHQCIPDDAKLYGEIDGHPMYLTDRPGSIKWLMAVTPIENTPYYWRFISRFEYRGSLTDVGFVYINNLGILKPSLLDKDLSLCVAAK